MQSDAAVATGMMLSVVDNFNSGIGGGCFILIRKPDQTLIAIDGREMAPAAATRDMFIRDGKAVPELSRTGPAGSRRSWCCLRLRESAHGAWQVVVE